MELDRLPSTVMPLPAVTMTFDLWIPKAKQQIYEPIYNRNPKWVKFCHWFLRYGVHKVFQSLPALSLTLNFDLLTPKANQYIYEENTCVTKIT